MNKERCDYCLEVRRIWLYNRIATGDFADPNIERICKECLGDPLTGRFGIFADE